MLARIKQGVKPYGGRRVTIMDSRVTPNGQKMYTVSVGKKKLTIAHYGQDLRDYKDYELERFSPAGSGCDCVSTEDRNRKERDSRLELAPRSRKTIK
jgi:hypothetical protein